MSQSFLRMAMGISILFGGLVFSLPNSSYHGEIFTMANSQTESFASLRAIERAVYNQINEYRESQGLNPLTLNDNISGQARFHSQNMADGDVLFSHNGFEQRIEAIATVISYQGAAENVAFNQGYPDPAARAVQSWLNSPGHLQNIQGDFDLTGVGVAQNPQGEYYFTQIFVLQRE